eukprot:6368424-Amphidinium_carterae.1
MIQVKFSNKSNRNLNCYTLLFQNTSQKHDVQLDMPQKRFGKPLEHNSCEGMGLVDVDTMRMCVWNGNSAGIVARAGCP